MRMEELAMTRIKKRRSWGTALLAAALIGTAWPVLAPKVQAAPSEPYTWRNVVTGAGGGFVPGIEFNAKEKDLIYARTDIGGAYRWNPADSSWIPLLDSIGWDQWGYTGVDALATDPVDPNRLYLAVGTYTNDWDPNNGAILRSTDKGTTWQTTPLPFKVGGNMPGRSMGERLVIDPNLNSTLFFGARSGNGLWKSTDYGATWSKVASFPNPGTYVQDPSNAYQSDIMGLAWIVFDPKSGTAGQASKTIYAGVADKATSIYKSTDGGATWAAVPGQPAGYLPHHGVISGDSLYITYNDGIGPYDGTKGDVWKLNLTTGAWTNISPVPSSSTDNYFGYGGLAADAQNPGTLVVSTLNSWWPDANLYRTRDGGATWTPIWEWSGYPNRTLRYTQDITAAPWLDFGSNPSPPEVTPKLGWMIGDLEIDPFNKDRMLYGTGATIYGTGNLTAWDTGGKVNLSVAAKGLEEMAVIDLISPPAGAPLISGVGDVSGFRHDDVTKAPAQMLIKPSSTSSLDYAEWKPAFMARVGYADKTADPNAKSISISYDGGANWFNPSGEPSGTKGGGLIAVGADAGSLVWSTSDLGVFHSKNSGNSWTASTGLSAGAEVAADRVNRGKFYAASAGKFFVSTDGGATFTQTAASGLPAEGVLNFKAMPGREGDIWLAGGTSKTTYGLWHSTDSGASFVKLPNVQEADVVGFGKAAPSRDYMALYVSAKIDGVRGIYRSDDKGSSWVRINDDAHQYGVTNSAITGDPKLYGRVYLGTNGRGILYGDSAGTTTPPPVQNPSISPTTAAFDKNTSKAADIAVQLTLNGSSLTGIRNGGTALMAGTHYTVSGSSVTLLKSYLASLPVGTATLTFEFSSGTTALAVAISDTTTTTPPPVNSGLRVQVQNGTTAATTNSIAPRIRLVNTGTSAIELSDVTLRYYYTIDVEKAQSFFCDWSSAGCPNVTGTFGKPAAAKPGADSYLEIGFKAGAGTLAAGKSIDIQARFSKNDWSHYTQTGDYSFDAAAEYTDRSRVTGYVKGGLVWGIEP
ncbi:xyloglucanase [Paenibacillus mucilaginosus]|uniref:Xeg74 n=2 Tax=Paenibacillus mucilaginosus TaxID=61624 RepID=F8F9J6_PAEMK|nr:X2-like carbohydrate binding domain-containing protein [Paenibacillus mucilaginosus]AEI43685.1 Xeg74 [Paenibacillus mucilaginosus KNP414]MCG7216924.1 xyloglucanase [Paenibacillus mucilaginosus]WDM25209.1 xyloglucanase [Paenibacillus mucilaginosus]